MSAAFRALPRGSNERHLLARARRFARFMHLPLLERVARWNSLFQEDVRELMQPDMIATDAQLDPLRNLRNDRDEIARFSPLGRLLREELRDCVRDTLLGPSAALGRYVRTDRVRLLIADHLAGRTNAGQRLWSLVCFERWLQLLPTWSAPAVTPR